MGLKLTIVLFAVCSLNVFGQRLELVNRGETSYQAQLGQVLKIPLKIKNTTDKPQFYIVRKVQGDLGGTHKGYFCFGDKCLEPGVDQFSKRIEPGQTIEGLYYTLETGLVTGQNNFKFEVFEQGHVAEALAHNVSVSVEERTEKSMVFQSRDITINDVYPNPVSNYAFIEYHLINDAIKANVIIHNILGMPMADYELPAFETSVKLSLENLAPGVYFYTLYLDKEGVLTRKLIVRK